ncbi:MAG TPA: zinc-binding dehydrogenase, partial [Gemmataceae bacterium]|nr:zinc-binding dehydrogenase [Gemmataceae bacterium]
GGHVIATVGSEEKAQLCRSWGVDRIINYKTEDVPTAIRSFTEENGVNVWYETQREPDLVRTVGLMARRGRIVLMAGRTAQPIFPVGPFYTRDLSLFGFAMFNSPPDEQRRCAEDIGRWLAEKKLHPQIGRIMPIAEAAAAHRLQEENTLHQAGTLTGKVVLTP